MMDDRRIEDLLRESWKPEPPDGMRERVMERAKPELTRGWFWFPRFSIPRWQLGFAAAVLLIVAGLSVSNSAREARLAALESCQEAPVRVMVAQRPMTFAEERIQLYKMLRDPACGPVVR
jgi:hypothetical protein